MSGISAQGWLILIAITGSGIFFCVRYYGWIGLVQSAIIVAVVGWLATNSDTKNGLVNAGIGCGIAWLLTVAPVLLVDRIRRYRRSRILPDERPAKKSLTFFD